MGRLSHSGWQKSFLISPAALAFTCWHKLARAIVGIHHATFAILLMVGISVFTAPTPNFGPSVLAMPITAFALLYLWRALGEGQRVSWFVLAVMLGVLLFTTYAGIEFVVMVFVFVATTRRGRRSLRSVDPWLAVVILLIVPLPHLMWLDVAGRDVISDAYTQMFGASLGGYLAGWLRQLELLFLAHAGLVVLVALGSKWHLRAEEKVPTFVRSFTDPFGRRFVYFFALAPPLVAALVAALIGERQPAGGYAPYLVLSGLAVVVLAGNSIPWHRPRLVATTWSLLLVVPPLSAAAAVLVLPWFGLPVDVSRPAAAIGQFFAESFERRTGTSLAIVSGEIRTAALVALGAPTRPSLYFGAAPERSPWVSLDDLRRKGAVVLWPTSDTRPVVPPDIGEEFPALAADMPHTFERSVQGRLPLSRIGWGVLRPQPMPAPR
jgi:4-amino-4-deoxy-L-arabinose transferase-like glycosyltransferase